MSIAVLKRKTFTNNPREAPMSGSGNPGGFSLNGTLRGNYIGQGNLAFRSKHKNKNSGNAYTTAVCNNDPTVLKTTVMNTRGMLSKRLKGIERVYSLAPTRQLLDNEECGCSMGNIIAQAPQFKSCVGQRCVGPLSQNWVKHPVNPNGDQGMYIEKVIKLNRKSNSSNSSNSCIVNAEKSYNGIVGILDITGYNTLQRLGKRYNVQKFLSQEQIDELVKNNSIVPFTNLANKSSCSDIDNINFIPCITKYKSTKKSCSKTNISIIKITKPGITTVDYGTYISKRLQERKFITPDVECNKPQPVHQAMFKCNTRSFSQGSNAYSKSWNNNITASKQIVFNAGLNKWTFI
jgi:hypothetical protein